MASLAAAFYTRCVELVEQRSIVRGMIRVSPGEDLVDSLRAVAVAGGWQEAYVTGAGVLELIELDEARGTVTLENAELMSLAGRIARLAEGVEVSLRATVTVGGELRSGRIAAAMTGGLILVVDAITLPAAAAGRAPTPSAAARPAAPPPTPPSSPTIPEDRPSSSALKPPRHHFRAKPVASRPVSAPQEPQEEDLENPFVDVGDVLEHPQLGRCEVVGEESSGGTKVRLASGNIRVLRLDALRVLPGRENEDGSMVYKIAGPRRYRGRF